MGSVHNETASQGRGIHEFDNMNLTDENVLKNLILYRREIDKYIDIRNANNYNCFEAGEQPIFYEMIDVMYIDLDNLIKETHLTDKQRKIIEQLMYGYTFKDISELTGDEYSNIIRIFANAVRRLQQQAEENWRFGLQWDKIKTKTGWKQCSKCKGWYPATEEYYRYHPDTIDKFQSRCRKCEN
jgi:hypothetical protein